MSTIQAPLQDLARLEKEAGVEWVHGQIVEKPVSIESSAIEARILFLLMMAMGQNPSACVFSSSMGYRCFNDDPEKFRKPDVSLVRTERLGAIDPASGFIPIPPDLAVEVLSPNDLVYDIDLKINEYLQNGFKLIWVVHPKSRTVVVHRAGGTASVLSESDEITGESALPGFRCKVAEFFAGMTSY